MPTFSIASSVNSTKPTNRGASIDILSISDAAIDSINIIKTSKRLIFASNIKNSDAIISPKGRIYNLRILYRKSASETKRLCYH